MPPATDRSDQKVTRDDIEAKLRQIRGEVEHTADTAKPIALGVAVAAAVVVVAGIYLLGKRRGSKKTTIVEIRRV